MNCPFCQTKQQQKELRDNWLTCPLCHGEKNVDFHRYVAFQIGDVLLLSYEGDRDASVTVMQDRCESIINECFIKYNKKRLPVIKRFRDYADYDDSYYSSSQVRDFYINQFKRKICYVKK